MDRRDVLIGGLTMAAAAATSGGAGAITAGPLITRKIPSSGEAIPVIGLGTSGPFEVGSSPAERTPLKEVLEAFSQPARGSSIRRRCIRRLKACSAIS